MIPKERVFVADGVYISERFDLSLASILARRGASDAAIGQAIAIDMPVGPIWTTTDIAEIVGTGPGTWLALRRAASSGWFSELESRLVGLASMSDQTGAYRLFRLEGPDAQTLLQRGAPVDLSDLAFPAGSAAVTMIGHVDVMIRRLADEQGYEVAVYRSYAESFLRWVDATVAELRPTTVAPIEASSGASI